MTEAGVPPEDRFYSLEEVAALLVESGRPIPLKTLRDCCRDGRIRAEKRALGWRVSHADLGRFLNGPDLAPAAGETPPEPAPSRLGALGSIADPAQPSRAKRALAELKLKLEEERRRRRARLPEGESVGPAEDVADRMDAPRSAGDPGASAVDVTADEPCDFLAELEADERLAPAAAPEETIEEHDFPGRDLRMTCELVRGQDGGLLRHGVYESWYGNGRQAARGSYESGRLTGAWQQWHENGRLHCVGAHEEGLPDGPWTWWDEEGRKVQEVHYDRGRPDGLWSQFHHNGRTWCEGRYRDGLPVGAFRYWDSEGRPA